MRLSQSEKRVFRFIQNNSGIVLRNTDRRNGIAKRLAGKGVVISMSGHWFERKVHPKTIGDREYRNRLKEVSGG